MQLLFQFIHSFISFDAHTNDDTCTAASSIWNVVFLDIVCPIREFYLEKYFWKRNEIETWSSKNYVIPSFAATVTTLCYSQKGSLITVVEWVSNRLPTDTVGDTPSVADVEPSEATVCVRINPNVKLRFNKASVLTAAKATSLKTEERICFFFFFLGPKLMRRRCSTPLRGRK